MEMNYRLPPFPIWTPRRRRESIFNSLRQVTNNLNLSRLLNRKEQARHLLKRNGGCDENGETYPLRQYDTEPAVLNISPANSLDPPENNAKFEGFEKLDALGISFPKRETKRQGFIFLDTSALPCLERQDNLIQEWVAWSPNSDTFDIIEDSPDHENARASTGPLSFDDAELAPAESPTTLSGLGATSPYEQGDNHKKGVDGIGDQVVLDCILQAMDNKFESPSGDLFHTPDQHEGSIESSDTESASFRTPPSYDKTLPELRHRKDPQYESPPSIAIIEATPTELDHMRPPHARRFSCNFPSFCQHSQTSLMRNPSTVSTLPFYCNRFVEPGGLCSSPACRSTGQISHEERIPLTSTMQIQSIEPYTTPEEHPSESSTLMTLVRAASGRLQSVIRHK